MFNFGKYAGISDLPLTFLKELNFPCSYLKSLTC